MSHKNNPGPAGGPMTGDWTRRGFLGLAGGAVGATLLSACGLSSSGGGGWGTPFASRRPASNSSRSIAKNWWPEFGKRRSSIMGVGRWRWTRR